MSQAVACPQCGAPLPPEAATSVATCPFCGATAAPPPRQVERVVERVVVVTSKDDSSPGGLRCPRCACRLREGQSGKTVLHGCAQCAGVWIARADVERLMQFRDTDVEQEARRMVAVAYLSSPPRNLQAMIACPECAAPMRRVSVPDAGNAVDVCDAHGTWFDREELPAFIGAYAEARAGEVDDQDLRAAGIPSQGSSDDEEDDGFFTGMFRNLWRMMK